MDFFDIKASFLISNAFNDAILKKLNYFYLANIHAQFAGLIYGFFAILYVI